MPLLRAFTAPNSYIDFYFHPLSANSLTENVKSGTKFACREQAAAHWWQKEILSTRRGKCTFNQLLYFISAEEPQKHVIPKICYAKTFPSLCRRASLLLSWAIWPKICYCSYYKGPCAHLHNDARAVAGRRQNVAAHISSMRAREGTHAREREERTHTWKRAAHDPVPTSQPAEMMNLCGRPQWWLITPCPAASAAHNSRCADWDATRPAPLCYRITSFFLNKRPPTHPGAQMRAKCSKDYSAGRWAFFGSAARSSWRAACVCAAFEKSPRHHWHVFEFVALDHTSLISIYANDFYYGIS